MSLSLDARQRAMLAEMHIRVWTPHSDTTDRTQAAPNKPAKASAPSVTPTASFSDATAPRPPGEALPDHPVRVATLGWAALQSAVQQCQSCALGQSRQQAIWGQPVQAHDTPHADWVVVLPPPSADEDAQGLPMVGEPGQLLDNILAAVGLQREGLGALGQSVFLTPAVKCAPPQARNPQAPELDMCAPYLARQIALLQPRVIVAMGLVAAQAVLRHDAASIANLPLGRLRAQLWQHHGIPVVVTYPSAYLLRNPADKAKSWADWCMARSLAAALTG
ncbi:MAG: uracil-DNA glycosylase [Betaproteobacteria bacterium]|nr:uracil-DNA glycosylase [Betaproteobacteria bacterium]